MWTPNTRSIVILAEALLVGAVLIICEPISLPTNLDFSQLYLSLHRIYEGKALYQLDQYLIDYNSQHSELRGAFPFTGPPWYVALLLPLGMLSPEKAALAWALLNVSFLVLTVALTCPGYGIKALGLIIISALLAAPVQGHLIVGQFSLIVGLGIALTIWGSSHHRNAIVAFGLALTTLRPHLGFPFIIAFLFRNAVRSPSTFMKQTPIFMAVFAILIVASLCIDVTSITSYPSYLAILNSLAVNKLCDTCSSIPIFATYQQDLSGYDIWRIRFALSLTFGCLLIAPLVMVRISAPLFISSTIFGILLAAPYLRNYDYVLLIPALLILIQNTRQLTSKSTQTKVHGLIFLSIVIAGLLPYLTDRVNQGSYLWLSPLMGYSAAALVVREKNLFPGRSANAKPRHFDSLPST